MAKTKISEFSSTPGNNTDIDGINIAEGCAPSGINDAIRELMSQLKDFQAGTAGDSFNGPVGTTTAAAGAFTTLSASSTVSGTGFSTYLASPPAIGGTAAAAGSFTTLSASSNVTLSGGTANGILYLNGSKVATSGTALTFDGTNLLVGAATSIANSTLSANQGVTAKTAAASGVTPYLQLYNGNAGTDLKTLRIGGTSTGAMAFETVNDAYSSSSEKMRLDSSGNLGIGTSSPAQRLEVFGASSGAANTYIRVTANIASGYEAGLQFFRNGGSIVNAQIAATTEVGNDYGKLTFSTANSGTLYERMRLDSSGNLGLGVTPSAWLSGSKAIQIGAGGYVDSRGSVNLDIGSNAYIDSAAAWRYISTGAATQTRMDSGAFAWLIAASGTAGNTISWTQAMTLDASGNLGIGNSSPGTKLDVAGNIRLSSANGTIEFNTGGAQVYSTVANTLQFATGGGIGTPTENMRLDSSGNLIVGGTSAQGTSSGRGNITINGSSQSILSFSNGGSLAGYVLHDGTDLWINNTGAGAQRFYTNGSERARIDSSGNVQIGTTTSNGRLSVDQGSSGTAGYFTTSGSTGTVILSDTGGNGAGIKFVGNGATTPNKYIRTNAGVLEFVNSAYSAVFANFTDAGAAYNTTGTWGTISDLRIKENVSTARNYLADLCRLRVVKYSLKSEKATSATKLGFIAQEVEEVFPNLVETSKNDFEGLDDMKQIKMSVLTPMLLKAVQELKAELDAVKAELATLKGS